MGFFDLQLTSLDIFFPNIDFLIHNKHKIKGLLITHGHEDHIGGIPYLWDLLECPIYTTEWTKDLILEKVKERSLDKKINIIIVDKDIPYQIGSFNITWFKITHSIVDSNLLLIETPLGNIVHTGDFKLNYNDKQTITRLEQLKLKKIDYLFCDSTNVLEDGNTKEEVSTKLDLKQIIQQSKGACWITAFASNLDRINIISTIASELGKKIVPLGRSIDLYTGLGIKHNILDQSTFISLEEAQTIPRQDIIFLITGGQGEYKSVLSNVIIENRYKVKLLDGDCVIFSSSIIPGNETRVSKMYNNLSQQDIQFYTANDFNIHVSGHPKKEDLDLIYNLIHPKCIIPIHGEMMHLKHHTYFANSKGFSSITIQNGEILELFNPSEIIIGQISVSRIVYEGSRILPYDSEIFKKRTKLLFEGTVTATLVIKNHYIYDVLISTIGLITNQEEQLFLPSVTNKIHDHTKNYLLDNNIIEESVLKEEIRIITRRYFREQLSKKPIVLVHLINIQ